MKLGPVSHGAGRYVVGEFQRFDQTHNAFFRAWMDDSLKEYRKFFGVIQPKDKAGNRLEDLALDQAGWFTEMAFAMGNCGGMRGLYSWESPKIFYSDYRPPTGIKLSVDDPARATAMVKKAARHFGASLVGVARLDHRWLYSHRMILPERRYEPVEIPPEYKFAIVMAIEMDYNLIRYSPAHVAGSAATVAYGKMAFTAGTLAQFIRYLGYKALPMGNDTALSVPLAIDAGLGELSRIGVMITPQYGPRVRLCKVFTDLPLAPDKPIEFGVWDFCMKCEKCARNCPGQAIKYGEPTDKPNNPSNNSGVLRWPINAEKCIAWWTKLEGVCSNCLRACPFNMAPGILHDWVRWGISNTRFMDGAFLKVDDLLGYGKQQPNPERYWQD